MSVQICEGVWRNRTGQRLVITQCKPDDDGQRWTDGVRRYSDDGRYYLSDRGAGEDLVAFVGLLPVSRPAETESTTAVAGGVSEDPGRVIYELEQGLKTANAEIERLRTELQQTQQWRTAATDAHSQSEARRIEQQTDIRRLQAEWQSEFTAAQQLRAENESLTVRLQRAEVAAAEALQRWETTEQVCLRIITALAGVRS